MEKALPATSAIKHVDTQLCIYVLCKVFVEFMAYYIKFDTKHRYRPKHLFKQAHKWTERFYWHVLPDQQLIDAKPV